MKTQLTVEEQELYKQLSGRQKQYALKLAVNPDTRHTVHAYMNSCVQVQRIWKKKVSC